MVVKIKNVAELQNGTRTKISRALKIPFSLPLPLCLSVSILFLNSFTYFCISFIFSLSLYRLTCATFLPINLYLLFKIFSDQPTALSYNLTSQKKETTYTTSAQGGHSLSSNQLRSRGTCSDVLHTCSG